MTIAATVVVPAYNVAPYLARALASLGQQTVACADVEVIVVDDASSDETAGLAHQALAALPFATTLITLPDRRGPGTARNVAIERARGRYIVLLDADDELEPQALRSTLRFHHQHPQVEYSYSRLKTIDAEGRIMDHKPGEAVFSRATLLHCNYVSHLKCFSAALHRRLGGFDAASHCEDYDHVLRASEILRPEQIAQNPAYLYRYRIHRQNRSIAEREATRQAAARAIAASLSCHEGIITSVRYSHRTAHGGGGYAFYAHTPEAHAMPLASWVRHTVVGRSHEQTADSTHAPFDGEERP